MVPSSADVAEFYRRVYDTVADCIYSAYEDPHEITAPFLADKGSRQRKDSPGLSYPTDPHGPSSSG